DSIGSTDSTVMNRFRLTAIVVSLTALLVSGCSWHQYVATRAFRNLTGLKLRYHSSTPTEGSLAQYRTIEVRKFDNEVLNQIPLTMETYLNKKIMDDLKSVRSSPKIQKEDVSESQNDSVQPTLVLTGVIED